MTQEELLQKLTGNVPSEALAKDADAKRRQADRDPEMARRFAASQNLPEEAQERVAEGLDRDAE